MATKKPAQIGLAYGVKMECLGKVQASLEFGTVKQLMNKINKHLLRGILYLAMPKIGDSFSADSMEPYDQKAHVVIVKSVLSWKISNSRRQILRKAYVK